MKKIFTIILSLALLLLLSSCGLVNNGSSNSEKEIVKEYAESYNKESINKTLINSQNEALSKGIFEIKEDNIGNAIVMSMNKKASLPIALSNDGEELPVDKEDFGPWSLEKLFTERDIIQVLVTDNKNILVTLDNDWVVLLEIDNNLLTRYGITDKEYSFTSEIGYSEWVE